MPQYTEEQAELHQLADEYMDEGLVRLNEGKLKAAEAAVIRAMQIYEAIGDRYSLAKSQNELSIIYSELGDESLDVDYLLDALSTALDEKAYDLAAKYFNNLGSKYMYNKNTEKALFYFERALEMHDKGCASGVINEDQYHSFHLILNLNMSTVYSEIGDTRRAREHYEKAKVESVHPQNEDLLFTFQAYEGLLLWRLGDHEEASLLVDSIIEKAQSIEYAMDYMDIMRDLLNLLQEMRDFDRWKKVLLLIDSHLTDDLGINLQVYIMKAWLEYYKAHGDEDLYRDACIRFFDLYQKMEADNFIKSSNSIDLKVDIRHAAKQKQITDSIVYLDPLTGIANRNRMLEDSKLYIEESIASHTLIMIGLIDIDYFKECNDTYGHIKGDECLRKVAEILQKAVGEYGQVYRYGGDEFLLLLPNVNSTQVMQMGASIKEALEEAKIPNQKSPISPYVTLSQGYTAAYAEKGDTINQLVNLADRALYSVKRCGRNNYKYMRLNELYNL